LNSTETKTDIALIHLPSSHCEKTSSDDVGDAKVDIPLGGELLMTEPRVDVSEPLRVFVVVVDVVVVAVVLRPV